MTASAPLPTVPGLTGFSVLARGGYATVYRAQQESVGRDVAVKVENRTLETERDRRRFLREARAAGRMSSHPHVVDLFDAGVTGNGHPYLIMELCDGSYAERMRSAPLSPAEVREVGFKIADALADAHSLGVLHRDVKPANILFSRFGEPALADFGLAILAEWRDVSITLDVLTPAYAPPETFRHSAPAPAADVYALCATLYALMRGRPPRWREDQMPSLLSLVDMFHERIPDLPGCPDELMAILRAGMANEEAARPSAIQLRDALMGLRMGPTPQVIVPPLGSPPIEPVYTSSPPAPDRLLESPFMSGGGPRASGSSGSGSSASESAGFGSSGSGPSGSGPSGSGPSGSGPSGSGSSGSGPSGSGSSGSGSAGFGSSGSGPSGGGSLVDPERTVPHEPGPPEPPTDPFSGRPADRPADPLAPPADPFAGVPWPSPLGGAPIAPPADPFVGLPVRTPRPIGRRGLALAVTGVVVVLAVVVGVGIAYSLGGTPGPTPSGSSAAPSASRSAPLVASSTACGFQAPAAAHCSGEPECYDAALRTTPCTGRHTWEVFARGDLPKGSQVRTAKDAPVDEVCGRGTLISVDISAATWEIQVILPSLPEQKAAPTTFRCLAGHGADALNGPQLHKA